MSTVTYLIIGRGKTQIHIVSDSRTLAFLQLYKVREIDNNYLLQVSLKLTSTKTMRCGPMTISFVFPRVQINRWVTDWIDYVQFDLFSKMAPGTGLILLWPSYFRYRKSLGLNYLTQIICLSDKHCICH